MTECQIFSTYESEKEFDAMLPMPKTLECQSTTHGKVLDAFPSRRLYEEEGCSYTGDTTVWRLSLYSPLAALHET